MKEKMDVVKALRDVATTPHPAPLTARRVAQAGLNEIGHLRARVVELEMQTTPRPITEPPEAGTQVLAFDGDPEYLEWGKAVYRRGAWYWVGDSDNEITSFTCWLPLPPRPARKEV